MVVLARGHSTAKWRKVSNTSQFSYRRVFSLLRRRLLAVHHVVHLVDEIDDYFRYFTWYEYAHYAAMFDQLEIPHKFFQKWIVLRMLGIRDCVLLNNMQFVNYFLE